MSDALRAHPPDESRADGSGADDPRPLDRRLRDLTRRVDELESLLREIRGGAPPDEIRCRRLVVVAADGFERVVISSDGPAGDAAGDVRVFARNGPGSTSVDLFAIDASEEDPAQVGLALFDRGDGSLLLAAESGEHPRLWIA